MAAKMIPSMRSSGSQGPGTEEVQSEDLPERGPPGTRDKDKNPAQGKTTRMAKLEG